VEALCERFGKYHVLEKIAQGGMAEVYKVKTVGIAGFEKIQALKRILPHQAREARFIRSFIDEARIAVELTHRNIVQVFDFGKADGELFLAMELIEGKNLRTTMAQAVSRDLLPPVPIAAYILSEVASGLDYAHRKADGYGDSLGIVHCDVSPSNVMLSTEGDIKILDFGIARATFASALERRRLRGKPRYMAPEQTIGETPTAASDVFALGIIAWELMTGLPLYRGTELKAILEAVRGMEPPRIDRLNPSVPRGIADAVATALARDPAQRGTAADLASACARVAMQAGARALARWLANLAARPSHTPIPSQPEVSSISAPPEDDRQSPATRPMPAPAGAPLPPARPSRTISLDEIPSSSVTGAMARVPHAGGPPAIHRLEPEASTTSYGCHEATATRACAPRFEPTATSLQPLDPARWQDEPTANGRAKLGGALPVETATEAITDAATTAVETAPFVRGSYAPRELAAGVAPPVPWFDDEATQHGVPVSSSEPGDTSCDELDAEPDVPAAGDRIAAAIGDAPIDDDSG
jgi:serine/threonine protein kinase